MIIHKEEHIKKAIAKLLRIDEKAIKDWWALVNTRLIDLNGTAEENGIENGDTINIQYKLKGGYGKGRNQRKDRDNKEINISIGKTNHVKF